MTGIPRFKNCFVPSYLSEYAHQNAWCFIFFSLEHFCCHSICSTCLSALHRFDGSFHFFLDLCRYPSPLLPVESQLPVQVLAYLECLQSVPSNVQAFLLLSKAKHTGTYFFYSKQTNAKNCTQKKKMIQLGPDMGQIVGNPLLALRVKSVVTCLASS